MAESLVRGGISRAVAEAFQGTRITSVEAPKTVVCPRPRLPSFNRGCSSEMLFEDDAVVPSKIHENSELDASITELRRILEVDCTLDSDRTTTFLGVSPPYAVELVIRLLRTHSGSRKLSKLRAAVWRLCRPWTGACIVLQLRSAGEITAFSFLPPSAVLCLELFPLILILLSIHNREFPRGIAAWLLPAGAVAAA